ncbi:MAG: DUF2975 domain-containing protein [Clostridia bacterium]|nr:DUF2975 domain-containing protein [Clostridia bacterium]
MKTRQERPSMLFTIMQVMACAAVLTCVITWAIAVLVMLRDLTAGRSSFGVMTVVTLLCATGVAGSGMMIAAELFCMCSRVKRETAFTAANVRSLGRMVAAFAAAGVLLIPVSGPLMDWFTWGLTQAGCGLWMVLPPFACWMAALLMRAVQLLLRRAVEMQAEQELTV